MRNARLLLQLTDRRVKVDIVCMPAIPSHRLAIIIDRFLIVSKCCRQGATHVVVLADGRWYENDGESPNGQAKQAENTGQSPTGHLCDGVSTDQ